MLPSFPQECEWHSRERKQVKPDAWRGGTAWSRRKLQQFCLTPELIRDRLAKDEDGKMSQVRDGLLCHAKESGLYPEGGRNEDTLKMATVAF